MGTSKSIVMDPADAIQVLSRLRGEGKLDGLPASDIVWLERQSEVLLRECLRAGYRVISLHLTTEDHTTQERLHGRVTDPYKATPHDVWLDDDPSRQIRLTRDIAEQMAKLEHDFA